MFPVRALLCTRGIFYHMNFTSNNYIHLPLQAGGGDVAAQERVRRGADLFHRGAHAAGQPEARQHRQHGPRPFHRHRTHHSAMVQQ